MKKCTKCKKFKKSIEFSKDKRTSRGLQACCKACYAKSKKKLYKEFPWKRVLIGIKQRCNNSRNKDYKYYGARGIQCLATEKQIKFLWFRDKAYNMNIPNIDRIDNDGHYKLNNCKFVEKRENIAKRNRLVSSKVVKQYDLNDKFIKLWLSQSEAGRYLRIDISSINKCVNGKQKTAGRFIWK